MERKALIKGIEYTLNKSDIMEQIIKKCSELPNKMAICSEYGCVTYGEMSEKVIKIASVLEKNGVRENTTVAVIADRKPETIMIILALVYMGACYLPIEKNCPEKRVEYMVNSTNSSYLISDNSIATTFPCCKNIKIDISEYDDISQFNTIPECSANRPIYIIFTSGTTGRPKGVSVRMKQLQNLCEWYINEHNINENSNILLINSMSFDASIKNIFSPLMAGGTIVLGSEKLFDTEKILSIIKKYHVTHLNCVPSLFTALTETDSYNNFEIMKTLKYIILGGERFNKQQMKKFVKATDFRGSITNVYGPTECTIISTEYSLSLHDLENDKEIPIGKPIYNMNVFILDDNRKLCDIGDEGTVYLSGIGTACYCTPDSGDGFEPDLFEPSEMMYNTKDIARINDAWVHVRHNVCPEPLLSPDLQTGRCLGPNDRPPPQPVLL